MIFRPSSVLQTKEKYSAFFGREITITKSFETSFVFYIYPLAKVAGYETLISFHKFRMN